MRRLAMGRLMTRKLHWGIITLLTVSALASLGCGRQKKAAGGDDGQLLSVINAADPRAAAQLTRGFYGIEGNAWRWTAKDFVVTLARPAGAAQNGATLEVRLAVPEIVINRLGQVSLSGNINGLALAPDTYSKSGNYVYSRDVPATALTTDPVTVEFATDKAVPPSGQDARELAVIVATISLSPK
jgi:hypothetical protein